MRLRRSQKGEPSRWKLLIWTAVASLFFGLIGLGMGLPGLAIVGYLGFVRTILQQPIAERTPLLLLGILLVFTAVQLVTIGLLAELQARTYHESQDKPTYVIREVRESLRA